jgi:Fe-S-cluster-containing dehydrogenase component/formate-dependent nitrite reductase membrane component NrfD
MTRYGFVIDQDSCIGCHACTVACKTEHQVPLGVNRTWVKYVEKGEWPDTKRFFSVMRCNHCTDAPCVTICPTTALYKRTDGIVDFDTDRCIGCKSCMQACPYDALYIDPGEHTAQKCNYCVHRVEVGLEPACVVVCPEQAIIAGDLDDPASRISHIVATEQVSVRAPEQGTKPNLFYKGVEESNIDPLHAEPLTDGGVWRDPAGSWLNVDLTPAPNNEASPGPVGNFGAVPSTPSAPRVAYGKRGTPPRVVYNTEHPMPWGWRVSSYFLTKGISAGLVLAVAVALLAGVGAESGWVRWGTPLVSGLFLALTGVLLVWDLKRPDRFYYLLTKGNPSSWLVRGAWILSGYAAVLGIWFLAGVAGSEALVTVMAWIGVPLALATAGYTAFLFGQAEARDLWQSPTLLWHMVAGGFAAGGGAALVAALFFDVGDKAETAFAWTMVGGAIALGLIALAELTSRHPTRNIADAMHHMTSGRFAREWWLGGQVLGVVVPIVLGVIVITGGPLWLGGLGGLGAMAGIWFADDAFVKAGQAVPLS